jgi:DNA polymerase III beta subunit
MKIEIKSKHLLKALEIVKPVIQGTYIPICENILLETKKDVILISATNTHHSMITQVLCNNQKEFKVLIPFGDLYNICKLIPDQLIKMIFNEGIEINCESGVYNIGEIAEVRDLPVIKLIEGEVTEIHQTRLSCFVLEEIEAKTIKFIHPDSAVTNYHGVCFDFVDGALNFVASNMVSISRYQIKSESKSAKRYMVQKKTIELMQGLKNSAEVIVKFSSDKIQIENEDTVVISPLIEYQFPDYEHVLQDHKWTCEVNREAILNSLVRANKFSMVQAAGLVIDDEKINVIADNQDTNKGFSETVKVEDSTLEIEIQIGINIKQIIDALNACTTDSVVLGFKDSFSPITLKESGFDNYIYQVSPIRYFNNQNN